MTTESASRYDESYYREYYTSKGQIPYERNEHWLGFFAMLGRELDRRLRPDSVLDVGCAHGFLVEALCARGVDARGFDVSSFAISQASPEIRDAVWVASLTDDIEGDYDLVTCIEVLEHLPPGELPEALDNLTSVTDVLLLSTTPGDFREPTHLNVQPPEYWAELLAAREFFRDPAFDATFVTPWAGLFRRHSPEVPKIVREYERERHRLQTERDELRSELQQPPALAAPEMQGTIDELRHDLRIAIDAVHGAEAGRASAVGEMQRLRYELAVAEEREREFVDLVAKIDEDSVAARREWDEIRNSRSFRLYWKLIGLYRRLLG